MSRTIQRKITPLDRLPLRGDILNAWHPPHGHIQYALLRDVPAGLEPGAWIDVVQPKTGNVCCMSWDICRYVPYAARMDGGPITVAMEIADCNEPDLSVADALIGQVRSSEPWELN